MRRRYTVRVCLCWVPRPAPGPQLISVTYLGSCLRAASRPMTSVALWFVPAWISAQTSGAAEKYHARLKLPTFSRLRRPLLSSERDGQKWRGRGTGPHNSLRVVCDVCGVRAAGRLRVMQGPPTEPRGPNVSVSTSPCICCYSRTNILLSALCVYPAPSTEATSWTGIRISLYIRRLMRYGTRCLNTRARTGETRIQ